MQHKMLFFPDGLLVIVCAIPRAQNGDVLLRVCKSSKLLQL